MIGLIAGTSEGKELLEGLNNFTDDIFVSTATNYGGELLKSYRYKVFNTAPLDKEGIIEKVKEHRIRILIDSSHPYAVEVTKNAMEACRELDVEYVRYERPSFAKKYAGNEMINIISDYREIKEALKDVEGNILNTTGSKNIEKILELNLKNRIIHRVLSSCNVMEKLDELGVMPEDIIAVKGVFSEEFNRVILREYNCKAIIMKDSGFQGGTTEKINAALKENVRIVVIDRETFEYPRVFEDIEELIKYVKTNLFKI